MFRVFLNSNTPTVNLSLSLFQFILSRFPWTIPISNNFSFRYLLFVLISTNLNAPMRIHTCAISLIELSKPENKWGIFSQHRNFHTFTCNNVQIEFCVEIGADCPFGKNTAWVRYLLTANRNNKTFYLSQQSEKKFVKNKTALENKWPELCASEML